MKGKNQALKVAILKDLESVASGKITPDVAPHLLSVLKDVISKVSDMKGGVSKAAESAARAIVRAMDPNAIKAVLPVISERIADTRNQMARKATCHHSSRCPRRDRTRSTSLVVVYVLSTSR